MEISRKEFESIMAERGELINELYNAEIGCCYFTESINNWLFKLNEVVIGRVYSSRIELWANEFICSDSYLGLGYYDANEGFIEVDDKDNYLKATENQISFINKVIEDDELIVID